MSEPAPRIIVSPLTAQDAEAAFGLARLAYPDLGTARWRQLVRSWTASRRATRGALLARDGAGRIAGFAPFEVRTDLTPGRSLWVETVVAVSLVDSEPAVRALALALSERAQALGCRRLKIESGASDRALRRALARNGAVRSALIQATV